MLEFGLLALVGLALFVVAGIFSAEMDSALMATATFVIGIITLEWGFQIGIWAMIVSNPLWAVGLVILYVASGAAYTAIWRWPEYIRKNKTEIMDRYHRWARGLDSNEDNSFDAFLDSDEYRFNAWNHKERLGTWVGMWPFSLFWELLRKPAIWVWNTAYASLGNAFQTIGRRTARKLYEKG